MTFKGLRLCVFLVLVLFTTLSTFGATITVTNTGDSGLGSLRSAIASAVSGDTIDFSLSYPATITLGSTLSIGTSLTISGPGASNLAISGNNAVGVFYVNPGLTVSISGVTIEKGSAFNGGGVFNAGTLTLTNCTLSGNFGSGGGGGIFNELSGTLTLTNSTVSGNSGGVGFGGGVENTNGGSTLTVIESTVSGNSAWGGGGIFNGSHGALTMTNSTVSGNSASTYFGGGIYNEAGATLTMTNSTVSGNSAPTGSGGAIANYASSALLKNTVVANSRGGNCLSFGGGSVTSRGHNLSDDTSCSSFLTSTGDQNNVAAGLDPNGLQNNGGPTKTISLLPTSPAVLAIPLSPVNYCTLPDGTTPVATDQRGVKRPQGSGCDIGAFELSPLDEINNLINTIKGFQLDRGTETSLLDKLNTATADIQSGNTAGACAAISDLILDAQSQSGNHLTMSQENTIVTAAKQIQLLLGC